MAIELLAPLLFFVAVVVGSIIRRAWAPLLALLIPLAFIPAGRDSDGTYTWLWALILFVPPVLIGLGLGVLLRRRLAPPRQDPPNSAGAIRRSR